MSLNRTVDDLKVKKLSVQVKNGNKWANGMPVFEKDKQYRLNVVFGNTAGKIKWDGNTYDKENIRITLIPFGIKINKSYKYNDGIKFYSNSTFSTTVNHAPQFSPLIKTMYIIEIAGPFKTTHADLLNYVYFKATGGLVGQPIPPFRWQVGINAAVRDHVWRFSYTGIGPG